MKILSIAATLVCMIGLIMHVTKMIAMYPPSLRMRAIAFVLGVVLGISLSSLFPSGSWGLTAFVSITIGFGSVFLPEKVRSKF